MPINYITQHSLPRPPTVLLHDSQSTLIASSSYSVSKKSCLFCTTHDKRLTNSTGICISTPFCSYTTSTKTTFYGLFSPKMEGWLCMIRCVSCEQVLPFFCATKPTTASRHVFLVCFVDAYGKLGGVVFWFLVHEWKLSIYIPV